MKPNGLKDLVCGSYLHNTLFELLAFNQPDELVRQFAVAPAVLCLFVDLLEYRTHREWWLVGPLRAERIEDVNNLKDSCCNRDFFAAQPIWVSAAIPPLMVVTNDRKNLAE